MKRSTADSGGTWALIVLALGLFHTTGRPENFSRQTARSSPQWLRDGIIYEIFPRNFSAQGNLNGITARLDELQDLGVNILWLMPIHPIGEKLRKGTLGSPYAVRDSYAINPDYGTEADLKKLVGEAHKREMKVILDFVADRTAWDSVLMQHPEFYKQDASGKILSPATEWTDVAALNYENPKLREHMVGAMKHWIDPAGSDVDGFRCNVAYMVPTNFWEEARAALEKVKPNLILLAEASKPELMLKAFDIDYSWPLLATLNNVLLNGAPASDLKRSAEETLRQFPQGALHLRISDNHDEARAVARFGIKGALAASVLMFSLDGVPLLYNGMEVGDATESGDPAIYEKMPIFWQPKARPRLREIYRDLIKMRKQYAPFRNQEVLWLRNSDEARLVTFMRRDAKDEFVILINFANRPVIGSVEVRQDQEFKPFKIAGASESPTSGFPLFRLNAFEWLIFHRIIQ